MIHIHCSTSKLDNRSVLRLKYLILGCYVLSTYHSFKYVVFRKMDTFFQCQHTHWSVIQKPPALKLPIKHNFHFIGIFKAGLGPKAGYFSWLSFTSFRGNQLALYLFCRALLTLEFVFSFPCCDLIYFFKIIFQEVFYTIHVNLFLTIVATIVRDLAKHFNFLLKKQYLLRVATDATVNHPRSLLILIKAKLSRLQHHLIESSLPRRRE